MDQLSPVPAGNGLLKVMSLAAAAAALVSVAVKPIEVPVLTEAASATYVRSRVEQLTCSEALAVGEPPLVLVTLTVVVNGPQLPPYRRAITPACNWALPVKFKPCESSAEL